MARPNAHRLPTYLRKDSRGYFLDYYVLADGIKKRKRVRLGIISAHLARRIHAKYLETMIENKFLLPKKPTVSFDEAADEFMIYSKARKRSYLRNGSVIKNLKAFFHGQPLENITLSRLEQYFAFRRTEGKKGPHLSDTTLNREVACLKAIINRAIYDQKLERSPLRGFKPFKEFSRTRTLTGDEYQRLISNCSPHIQPIVELAYVTAMRKSEILTLKWKNLDFQNKVILLDALSTKTREKREIPLDDRLLNLFRQFTKTNETEYVFSYRGRPIRELKTAFNHACAKAGIDNFRFHDLRHCGVTNMRKAGVPDNVIMSISGHKTAAMFRRYDSIDRSDRLDALEKVRRMKETRV